MKREPKATTEDKRHFETCLLSSVNSLFGQEFTHDSSHMIVEFYDSLSPADKRDLWAEMTQRMGKPREQIYKFYNNTFKANVLPQWPEELLNLMVSQAGMVAQDMGKDFNLREDEAIRAGVERVKSALHIRDYVDFHEETAHHKIRNAFLPVFRETRAFYETVGQKSLPPVEKGQAAPVLHSPTPEQPDCIEYEIIGEVATLSPDFLRAPTPTQCETVETGDAHHIFRCRTQENVLCQPLQQATTNDFIPCQYVNPEETPALPAPLLTGLSEEAEIRYSDVFFSAEQHTEATVGSLCNGDPRTSYSIYDGEEDAIMMIEYASEDEDIGLGFF